MIKLEELSESPPEGATSLLMELGTGENGFSGTEFARDEMDLPEYLRHTMNDTNAENIPQGRVPQTTYWIINDSRAIGLLRMRHVLNDYTRIDGGHIGYYIRPSERRKGFATQALRLGLKEIAEIGVDSVLLTTKPGNHASIRVIEENDGSLNAQVPKPESTDTISQYWIELT